MKSVFMGTPDFACTALRALMGGGHEVAAVFTRADTPKNRGMKMTPPPVKLAALEYGLPVFQPATLRDGEALHILRGLAPDVIVVAAYGRILPPDILSLPRLGCVNVHASLLPKYRGASPIASAILHGETETGVSIMQMQQGLDTGDVLLSVGTPIGPDESFGQLQDRLAGLGAKALLQALAGLEAGVLVPQKQDEAAASYAPLIKNQDARVGFAGPCREMACAVRAFDPAPGAFAFLGGDKLKLFGARALEGENPGVPPGAIVRVDGEGAVIRCGAGCVQVSAVQGAGGRKMPADAFFRGHRAMLSQQFC